MMEEKIKENGAAGASGLAAVLAVVGPRGVGKQTFITRLTAEFSKRGRTVGVIRLDRGPRIDDRETRPYLDAGALSVIEANQDGCLVRFPDQAQLTAEIMAVNYATGCELVLVETEQLIHLPGIEIYRRDLDDQLITRKAKYLLAVVGDTPEQDKQCPVFGLDDAGSVADLIETKLLTTADDAAQVTLKVNGRKVPMLPFVKDIFDKSMTGMVSSLKSCQDPVDIEITIKKRRPGSQS